MRPRRVRKPERSAAARRLWKAAWLRLSPASASSAAPSPIRFMAENSPARLSAVRTRLGDSMVPHSQNVQVNGQPR